MENSSITKNKENLSENLMLCEANENINNSRL